MAFTEEQLEGLLCGRYRWLCCLDKPQYLELITMARTMSDRDADRFYSMACQPCAADVTPQPPPGPTPRKPRVPAQPEECKKAVDLICAEENFSLYAAAGAALAALGTQIPIPPLAYIVSGLGLAIGGLVGVCQAKSLFPEQAFSLVCTKFHDLDDWLINKFPSLAPENFPTVMAVRAAIRYALSAIWTPRFLEAMNLCCGIAADWRA